MCEQIVIFVPYHSFLKPVSTGWGPVLAVGIRPKNTDPEPCSKDCFTAHQLPELVVLEEGEAGPVPVYPL